MPESQGYVFLLCLHRKRGIALIGVKNIKTGLNINGYVLFTDESRFSLTGDSKRVYIWRESGTRNDPSHIVERDRFSVVEMCDGGNNDRWTYASTRVQKRICDRPDISG
ncbi:transposable element Tc1 transposase [Trichonephila clavipes]|nr:transposable element Tc1 transposase [Trichonephila clavipes]